MMGFISLKDGDVHLNPVAYQFIQGDVDQRKHIFRSLSLSNIQLVQQIYTLLKADQTRPFDGAGVPIRTTFSTIPNNRRSAKLIKQV